MHANLAQSHDSKRAIATVAVEAAPRTAIRIMQPPAFFGFKLLALPRVRFLDPLHVAVVLGLMAGCYLSCASILFILRSGNVIPSSLVERRKLITRKRRSSSTRHRSLTGVEEADAVFHVSSG
jgi:hypothetical protein